MRQKDIVYSKISTKSRTVPIILVKIKNYEIMKILAVGMTFTHADIRVEGYDKASDCFLQLLCDSYQKSPWTGYASYKCVKVVIYVKEFDMQRTVHHDILL
jgi:hypothetical protein